jgi:hypothetical protein
MYGHSLLKLSNFFVSIMDKYIFSYHFLKKLTKFDIIIIMW